MSGKNYGRNSYVQEHLVCVASMVKLLCLVINLLSCGRSEESPNSCPEDGGSMFFQTDFTISQLKRQ